MNNQIKEDDGISLEYYPFIQAMNSHIKTPEELPLILYQYTDINGVQGILEKKELWATDFRYLNDSTEIKYGVNLVQITLQNIITNGCDKFTKNFITEFLKLGDDFFSLENIYVACFCEDGDLLSQWRGYANNGEGYSIGFDSARIIFKIAENVDEKAPNMYVSSFLKVIYLEDEQKQIIKDTLKIYTDFMKENKINILDDMFKKFVTSFSECISRIICSFKHPAFIEENEWRILSFADKQSTSNVKEKKDDINIINFRANKEFLIPYIKLKLDNVFKCPTAIPIFKIISGPSKSQNLKILSIKQFTHKLGYDYLNEDTIFPSSIPFRK